ncbi:hypothetical protein PRIPAC_79509 [Pristionchus pacificus]|nr:hypothetical protein PRIPAC_79509 [Pristionchus pacificus]
MLCIPELCRNSIGCSFVIPSLQFRHPLTHHCHETCSIVELREMPSCLALQARIGGAPEAVWQMVEKAIRESHNVECYAYDLIGRFEGKHAVPRRFYAKKFDDENTLGGQLCMEFAEDSKMFDVCKPATIEQMKQTRHCKYAHRRDVRRFPR